VHCWWFRISGLGFLEFRGSSLQDFGFRVCRILGFGFRVSKILGFGFRVSGFGFRVPGFGFRVSGFGSGFRVETVGARSAMVSVDPIRALRNTAPILSHTMH